MTTKTLSPPEVGGHIVPLTSPSILQRTSPATQEAPYPTVESRIEGQNFLANEPSDGGAGDGGSTSASVNDAAVRHSKYFFDDGNVTFLVDGTLFCVHRYLFSRGSEHFSAQFAQFEASDYEALPPTISLDDVKCKDFEAFLFVLYSENFGVVDLSYEQWKSVLHLSTLWAFPSLRKWALSYMMPPTPHDQLLHARAYSVRDWVVPALSALCRRRAPLSLDEASQMDIKDVVLVNTVREDIRHPALQVDVDEIPLRVEAAQARLHADAAEGVAVPPAILQRGAVGQSPLPVVLKQASKKEDDSEHGEEPYTLPLPEVNRPEPSDKSRGPDGRQSPTMMYLLGSPRWASVDRNSAGSGFQIGQFSTSAMKMSSEERFLTSSRRLTSVGGVSLGNSLLAIARPNSPNDTVHDRTPSKHNADEPDRATIVGRASPIGLASNDGFHKEFVTPLKASANRWVAASTRRNGLGLYGEQKVRGLLNKLTMVRFDSISDQIITWANKSEREKDGRTLRQVINLVFEAVIDNATLPELYARLCRKMMEQISHTIQDDGIGNAAGEPFAGGQLFREYLFNRCQEGFKRGWVDKETTAVAAATRTTQVMSIKKVKVKTRGEGSDLYSEDAYAVAKSKHRGLGLIRFIGELFKLQMLTERIINSCIKKFLGSPGNEEIEGLCELLTTAGCLLDTQKSRVDLDVYFLRMRELTKNKSINARMMFMLQDVIELRERGWIPSTIMPVPSLQNIPYDLLLSIVQHLDLADIYALQSTCKYLRYGIRTRPVYRELAASLLRRCRALPLYGFNQISDLSTDQLVEVVNQAARLERGWLTRTPRPALNAFVPKGEEPVDGIATGGTKSKCWYKVARTPPDEEVDWLFPITAGYMICATKSGKVVCWDVHRDVGIAEWNHGERWELLWARVEFERRAIYFTTAKVLRGRDDEKVMQFELMQIHFPEQTSDSDEQLDPYFSTLRSFKTLGIVMNVFTLDPEARLLVGLMRISRFNSIGLYVLLDWNKEEYVFVDTAIQWTNTANWSCIVCDGSIVIHSEEATFACQHFFPLSALSQHVTVFNTSPSFVPRMTTRLKPTRSISRGFIFPVLPPESNVLPFLQPIVHNILIAGSANQIHPIVVPQVQDPTPPTDVNNLPNPWIDRLWYPESAGCVRQWWPTLPSIPRLRSSAVLFSQRHPYTNVTKYVLAQHYFTVPLSTSNAETDASDATMRMWYVSVPFEVVCVSDEVTEDDLTADAPPRQRPLFAVDFGHAVWLEHVRTADEENEEPYERRQKRLRFVSFPGVRLEGEGYAVWSGISGGGGPDGTFEMEGMVRTLAIPEELDLHEVNEINLDHSQGIVILSVRQGKMFILSYE